MYRRNIRIGNYVQDSNGNQLKAGATELEYAGIFSPVVLTKKFLNEFAKDTINNHDVYYRYEGANLCSLEEEEGEWRVSIHGKDVVAEGTIHFVHELQNLLADCGFRKEIWEVCG